jgi:hypothetical protein
MVKRGLRVWNVPEIWLLIGQHGNQQLMCRIWVYLFFVNFFLSFPFLLSYVLVGFISSLPQLAWNKRLWCSCYCKEKLNELTGAKQMRHLQAGRSNKRYLVGIFSHPQPQVHVFASYLLLATKTVWRPWMIRSTKTNDSEQHPEAHLYNMIW